MPAFVDNKGGINQVRLEPTIYREAHEANLSLPAFLDRKYPMVDRTKGSAFQQICVSEGLALTPEAGPRHLRSAPIGDILSGKAAFTFDAAITEQKNSDYGGTQARILFPAAVVDMIENQLQKDLVTDTNLFNQMVALNQGIASDLFEQPIINYQTMNGPDGANRFQPQRVAQLAEPPAMATFTTSQTARRLPSWALGAEFSQQALKSSTLDMVALSLGRLLAVEADSRVYTYLSMLWSGDLDMDSSAISAVTASSLHGAGYVAGTLTHKAWVKWLYRQRRYRRISHVVCDLDTYMKIEARTGRPGSIGVLDPTLPKIDPQASALNPYVDNVKVMLVDSAADGGPVPANTVWGVDSRYGIVRVTNTAAAYTAAESFALKRSEAFRIDWSETVYRQFDSAFDALTID